MAVPRAVSPPSQGLGLQHVQYDTRPQTTSTATSENASRAPRRKSLSGPDDPGMFGPRSDPESANVAAAPATAIPKVSTVDKPVAIRSKSAFALNGKLYQDIRSETSGVATATALAASAAHVEPSAFPARAVRHGWGQQTPSLHDRASTATVHQPTDYMYWTEPRHDIASYPTTHSDLTLGDWRMRDRLKTVGAVLVPCLNPAVPPPGVTRTENCAKLICWVDSRQESPIQPTNNTGERPHMSPLLMQIGKALQAQFEPLSMRTRIKVQIDPNFEVLKKQCMLMRKNSKDERVLFYYNGYGVPEPTLSNGEIWIFNPAMTQYIPLALDSLQEWLKAPGIFLYDCSHAGRIITQFHVINEKRAIKEKELLAKNPEHQVVDYSEAFHLAACRDNETLPTNPDLPADLFTSCLTTPITMAVRFFVMQNRLHSTLTLDDVRDIPGKISERRSPLGELNWIFTAITDTIAWNTLYNVDKSLFKRLFRQDLMVAALMRNFLLAQRVMRVYGCNPISHPPIPSKAHQHPLWESWDYAVETVLQQLPAMKLQSQTPGDLEYQHSEFFTQQLSAFEIYLGHGALRQERPEQLPIVLQVLLSQVHRLRALVLLSKFLDLGPWAVHMALSIGIFPYVLKLLQSQAQELKPVMIFIWARLLAIDQSCQTDLLKDNGYQYFVNLLNPDFTMPIANLAEHRAMCAFIIATFCRDFPPAQNVCLSTNPDTIEHLAEHSQDPDNARLRQHSCLCISMLWNNLREARWQGVRAGAQIQLCRLVNDDVPEVRTAMLTALASFIGIPDLTDQIAQLEADVATNVLPLANDGSVIVRKEYVVFLSVFVGRYKGRFLVAAWEEILEERKKQVQRQTLAGDAAAGSPPERRVTSGTSPDTSNRVSLSAAPSSMPRCNIFASMWRQILVLSADPHPEVSRDATIILDYVLEELFASNLGQSATRIVGDVIRNDKDLPKPAPQTALESVKQQTGSVAKVPLSPGPPGTPKSSEGYLTAGLRRTASVAAQLVGMSRSHAKEVNYSSQDASQSSQSVRVTPGNRGRAAVPLEWTQPPNASDPHISLVKTMEAKQPSVPGFEPRDPALPPTVPLKSTFFDWSTIYFREPQMRPTEADEQGSLNFIERTWRRNRNDEILAQTAPLHKVVNSGRWQSASAPLDNGALAVNLSFHQFEDHLVTSDDHETVSVWDWKKNTRLNRFSNGNPLGSRITDLRFINEDDVALVMTGSSDGIVKLYRHYENKKKIELATAFRALSDLVPSTHNAGLVLDWQQPRGHLLVAGDERVIRIWDAGTEKCVADIPARSGSNVTSLTSDHIDGNIFVAGFGDGAVRVFDVRARPNESLVRVWREHRGWIVGTRLQRGATRELITCERGGSVRLWDIRNDKSVNTIRTRLDGAHVGVARTMSLHDYAPMLAIGTSHNSVRVYNTNNVMAASPDPTPMTTIDLPNNNHASMLQSHRVKDGSPVGSTVFHPHRLLLACSTIHQGEIRLYRSKGAGDKKGVIDSME